ncbi:TPA: hypothetical protein ACMD15_003406 [Vibrio cholerae]
MAITYEPNIESVGFGGGMGGFGGAGYNPLLWLITLGFLRGNGGFFGDNNGANANTLGAAGVIAGENSAKIDCLAQGQNMLAEQLRQQSDNFRFDGLNNQISELAGIARDGQFQNTMLINNLSSQLSQCCCDLRTGQANLATAIQMQTNDLLVNANNNTQRIVDLITSQSIESKNERISELERQAQTATLAALIQNQCAPKCCPTNGGNSIDINVLAAALSRSGGMQAATGN